LSDEEPKRRVKFSDAWREARALIWARRRRLALGLGLMGIGRVAGLILPASTKILVDEIIGGQRHELLWPLGAAVLAGTVIQAGTGFALSQLLGVTAQRAITEMRKTVQRHVERLPVSYFDSTKSGVLISRIMTDAEGIRNLVGTGLVQLVGGLMTAAIALGVIVYLNWRLTLVVLAVLLGFMTLMAIGFSRLRPLFRERGRINAEVTGRLAEALGGVRIVKAYTAEKREELVFARGAHRLFRNVAKSITAVSGVASLSTLIFGLVSALILVLGGRAIVGGTMTLGDFVMYVAFTGMVAMPMVQISSIGTQLSEAFAGLDRIREIMQTRPEDEADGARRALPELEGEVVFENVEFEYQAGRPVLKGVSLRARPGTTTALVGSSGAGKSTLISLVLTFNRPSRGRLLIDGRPLEEARLKDYRRRVAVVLQDNFLFDGTIAENIRYGRPRASEADMREASRIAHCDEFIERLPQGYATIVGERGVKLSGGQRQRVAIARAILADPKILVLDEATSSLDSESEGMIQDGLRSLRRGRTTFVIAHRLSTIQSADQILVIEDGRILERGTHEELLAAGRRYRELYDKQYRLERDRFINPGEDFTPEPAAAAAIPTAPPSRAL